MKRAFLGLALFLGLAAPPGAGEVRPSPSNGVNQLGLDLLHTSLQGADNNACCSPFSVANCLALTCLGARGETASQLSRGLHCAPGEVESVYSTLDHQLLALPDVTLTSAQRLWSRFDFLPDFANRAQQALRADSVRLDFGKTESACETINGWASRETRGRIPQLLRAGDLDPKTEMVVTNAVYFKGAWRKRFDPHETSLRPFHRAQGDVMVPTMHQLVEARVVCDDVNGGPSSFDLVELPYAGGRLWLTLLWPIGRHSLAEVEQTLTLPDLQRALDGLQEGKAELYLPRFTIGCRLDLTRDLRGLTGPLPFSAEADMTGALGQAGQGMGISKVVHVATMTTDEQGGEASAATAGVLMRSGPHLYALDRPFLFILRDGQTGTFLFLGRVADPSKVQEDT